MRRPLGLASLAVGLLAGLAGTVGGTVATLAAATENWLGLLLSLGVIGFAITHPRRGQRVKTGRTSGSWSGSTTIRTGWRSR